MQNRMIRKWGMMAIWLAALHGPVAGQPGISGKIDLEGTWSFKIDSLGVGMSQRWMDHALTDSVPLPGTMAQWQKGIPQQQPTTTHLNVPWQYTGAAWYQRWVQIPVSWKDRDIYLNLERTKVTSVWIDGTLVGHQSLLSATQTFKLPAGLMSGRHRITIRVNNDPRLVSVGGSHALSEHTQTNWNGVIGAIYLEAKRVQHLKNLRISTDTDRRMLDLTVAISDVRALSGKERLQVTINGTEHTALAHQKSRWFDVSQQLKDSILTIRLPLDNDIKWWSEYHPAIYQLSLSLVDGITPLDRLTILTGFRTFKASGTRFQINNTLSFLRGKNECAVFPLTGYPPTSVAAWRRHYRIAKQYGINHYRFHSYTPPQAAFEAADLEGIYVQAELPNWSNFNARDSAATAFQLNEGKAIIDAYGNHPSFVMLTLGNELAGDTTVAEGLIAKLRAYDNKRRLYAFGSNAFFTDPHPGKADDFWVTMRSGKEMPDGSFDLRGSFATTEDQGNGILNGRAPNTSMNFSKAIADRSLPVVTHEIGQYQVYPDYSELPQYTGVLKPLNLRQFQARLVQAGMGHQADSFLMASGRLVAQLYRREIEMAVGTPGLAGFQLLDLQDFPGQGTALVGLLNAFMETKGLIEPETFRQSSNDLTLQLRMPQYTWTNAQRFQASIQVVNHRPELLTGRTVQWTLLDNRQRVLAGGSEKIASGKDAFILPAGTINISLATIAKAMQLTVVLRIPGTAYKNEYPIWVYPDRAVAALVPPSSVQISDQLTPEVLERLAAGGKVLLFPRHDWLQRRSVKGQFISEFWNWKVFKEGAERQGKPVSAGTLGLLIDERHPVFRDFPTAYYSSWQWWSITKKSRPLILDTLQGYRPIVQVIDNIDRNHRLGLIFEFTVGKGKLLICMAPLDQMKKAIAARQLYYSILRYMDGPLFQPPVKLSVAQLKTIL